MNWIPLTGLNDIDSVKVESENKLVLIFKHSTRCSISRTALKYFEQDFEKIGLPNVTCYFLDLLSYREVSNQIAVRFSVHHESPQLLLIHKSKCILNQTHEQINAHTLKAFIDKEN